MMNLKENIAQLLDSPDRVSVKNNLQSNFGEFNEIDFKVEICAFPKLARHFLAMANSGGGVIILGVGEKENGEIILRGLSEFEDKAKISNGVKKYLPDNLEYDVFNFDFKETEYGKLKGKMIQLISIKNTPKHLPFIAIKEGEGIKKDRIYIRRGTQSIEANNGELQKIINKRIETEYSTSDELNLETHLAQLKILFSQLTEYYYIDPYLLGIAEDYEKQMKTKNENYPKENYENFIMRIIKIKKEIIEKRIKE